MPKGLNLSKQEVNQLCTNVLDRLVELHQVDYKAAGLDTLGKGEVIPNVKLKVGSNDTERRKRGMCLLIKR
ncbi:MAG: hypothetical protein R2728_13960 [Chitinophagales bacterium]